MHIPAHRIIFTEEEILDSKNALEEIMSSGKMILGNYTEAFEEEYARLHGRQFGVAVASDTAAIEIALRMYGIGPGDKVLYPANGFFGIVIPILRCGAEPVFFDIRWDQNLFITEVDLAELVAKHKPKALILMHTGGMVAARSRAIGDMCKYLGVICIEDAAHAPGAKMNEEYAGSFGDISCFSLYATKPINAGEGGMLLTDDEEIANLAKVYRNYGRTSSFGRGIHIVEGYSWRLTEIQAAIGLGQVKRQDEIKRERNKIAMLYNDHLALFEKLGVRKYVMAKGSDPNWYRYLMLLPEGYTSDDRAEMKAWILKNYEVQLPGEVYELPAHLQPVWGGKYDHIHMPNSEEWANRHFALPIYNTLNETEQYIIIESVYEYLKMKQSGCTEKT